MVGLGPWFVAPSKARSTKSAVSAEIKGMAYLRFSSSSYTPAKSEKQQVSALTTSSGKP
jgi:hypothetical protein